MTSLQTLAGSVEKWQEVDCNLKGQRKVTFTPSPNENNANTIC